MQRVNRMPRNRLPRVMKHYSPTGIRNHGKPLKILLDTWDRNRSTSGPTPWQKRDDDIAPISKDQGSLPLKMGQTGCPETSVSNYQYILRNILGQRKYLKVQFEVTGKKGGCNADRSIVNHISANYSNNRRTAETSGSAVSWWVMKAVEQRYTLLQRKSMFNNNNNNIYLTAIGL